jgi:large subunit ribosomal protein L5
MIQTKERQSKAFETLSKEFGYKNRMASPRLLKVIVSTGVGKKRDKKVLEHIEGRLAQITGQQAARRAAKQSIASFKVREGDTVGYQTTLRGARMYDFIDKLVHVVLPRTRDFRGLKESSVDSMGNLTVGIKENTIFPETSEEDLKDVFGLAVTVVTTAKSKEEAVAFFKYLGFPLNNK